MISFPPEVDRSLPDLAATCPEVGSEVPDLALRFPEVDSTWPELDLPCSSIRSAWRSLQRLGRSRLGARRSSASVRSSCARSRAWVTRPHAGPASHDNLGPGGSALVQLRRRRSGGFPRRRIPTRGLLGRSRQARGHAKGARHDVQGAEAESAGPLAVHDEPGRPSLYRPFLHQQSRQQHRRSIREWHRRRRLGHRDRVFGRVPILGDD